MIYSSVNLRYFLLAGPFSLKPFRILKRHQTDWCGRRLDFYALGASHAVTLMCQDLQLTELLTCIPATSEAQTIAEASAAYLPLEIAARVFGIDYRCRISGAEEGEGVTLHSSFDGANQIEAAYPTQSGYPTPVTRIGWRIRPAQISLETMHTYPEEGRVIRTESFFGFPGNAVPDGWDAEVTSSSLALK